MSAKKILIFRTVAITSMPFVAKDVVEKYGPDVEITVITRPENHSAIKEISSVKNIICFSMHVFDIKHCTKSDIDSLMKQQYDMAIVPTEGAVESYDNVIRFINKTCGKIPIDYWVYPKQFIKYKHNLFRELFKKVIMFIAGISTSIICLPYIIITLYNSSKNSGINKFPCDAYEY